MSEQLDASSIIPPEIVDPSKRRLDQSSKRREVKIAIMWAKRMMLAHCAIRNNENLISFATLAFD
jgi:hypothetical protein